jgi:predicted transcriptional regulator
MMSADCDGEALLVNLTADIVAAHVSNNSVAVRDVRVLIENVHAALLSLNGNIPVSSEPLVPFVSIKSSVKSSHIVCLECGVKQQMLRRHLGTSHGLSVDAYRARWDLGKDYPLVAPDYSQKRRDLAIEMGLGKNGRAGRKRK